MGTTEVVNEAVREGEVLRAENLQLRRLLAEASRLAEFGRYAAKLNHELKQPLFAIKGLAQLLLDRDDPLDATETREFARSIVEQAERMGHLVNHLRTLSLPATRRPTDGKAGADVKAVVNKVLGLLAARLQNGPEVLATIEEGLPKTLLTEDALQQILINLATNALDAMVGCPSSLLQLRARLSAGTTPASIELAVGDTGRGIDPAVRSRLFEPFFSTKTEDSGTGLGLAVSRDLARAAGGELALAPEGEADRARFTRPSKTVFVLTLPVVTTPEPISMSSLPSLSGS